MKQTDKAGASVNRFSLVNMLWLRTLAILKFWVFFLEEVQMASEKGLHIYLPQKVFHLLMVTRDALVSLSRLELEKQDNPCSCSEVGMIQLQERSTCSFQAGGGRMELTFCSKNWRYPRHFSCWVQKRFLLFFPTGWGWGLAILMLDSKGISKTCLSSTKTVLCFLSQF